MIPMFDVSREEITEGSIPRALVALAAPLVAQNLVQVANQVIDTFWVGRLGEDAVAAVGLNFPIVATMFSATMVAIVGTQILVAQRIGAEEDAAARRMLFHGLVFALVVGAVLGVVVAGGADAVVRLVGAEGSVAPLAAAYLGVYMLLFPFISAADTLEQSFVGAGDSKIAMSLNFLAVGLNILLDPFLILGLGPFPALGVRGAAFATGLGYSVSFLVGLAVLGSSRGSISLGRADADPRVDEFRELLDVGFPLAGQRLAGQSVRVLVVGIVAVVGGAAGLAAYTVGARIASLAFIPANGLKQAAQSMIGQNLGADRPDRAETTTWVGVAIAVGALSVVGVAQWFVPGLLTNLFVPDITPTGFDLTVEYLRVLAYGYWGIGATYLLIAGFNGASRTRTSFFVDLGKYWGIRLPIAIAALPASYTVTLLGVSLAPGLDWGMSAIFWAVTGSNVVAAVCVGAYYFYTARNGMLERAAEQATPGD